MLLTYFERFQTDGVACVAFFNTALHLIGQFCHRVGRFTDHDMRYRPLTELSLPHCAPTH